MTVPSTTQVLELAAVTASQRLAAADARWRWLAHTAIPNTRGEYDTWTCYRCHQTVSDPSHAQTCLGATP
jgi:hypothetical protein